MTTTINARTGLSGWTGAGRASQLALPVYTLTIFLSAFLLFGVQPMFTKMVMPVLGGTPAVWSVAMVFFQSVLLAGYAYAHGLTRWLDARAAAVVHLALMVVVLIAGLPIAFGQGWGTPPEHGQALWLIGVFTVSVGLPFFAVSAKSAPRSAAVCASSSPRLRAASTTGALRSAAALASSRLRSAPACNPCEIRSANSESNTESSKI